MPIANELRAAALQIGRAKKRDNAIVALLSGMLPAFALSIIFPLVWERWLAGLAIGLVWGNAFEYGYHRWLLHRPHCRLAQGHLEHHIHVGTVEEPEHVTLGKSPPHIALLFATNGAVVVTIDALLHLGISSGIFLGWTIYLIAAEEIHWRIHLNEWLPPGLRFTRRYHMAHHDLPDGRFNVFLPLFDWLFQSNRSRAEALRPRSHQ
ncbi:MAG TPA: sterol desaturase family protein [Sphingomicrobium sp.]|nr:sterol desaturase family protein [Sphingomicrobium sp.]